MEQLNIFDYIKKEYKIKKPIRLIEVFSGVGAQAMALRNIGVEFEHYRAIEIDKYAMLSYNAIHGTSFETSDVTKIKGKDLGIVDTDKYEYILTYSYPCTDISVAGKMMGMEKGSGTRSSLLWEIERLLNETEQLPQILVLENVAAAHSKQNIKSFQSWISFLESKGYSNFWQDLNAKDYGVAQNRLRVFMVSIYDPNNEYNYKFPQPIPLTKTMKDYLEDEVPDKYYITSEKAKILIDKLIQEGKILTNERTNERTNEQTDNRLMP